MHARCIQTHSMLIYRHILLVLNAIARDSMCVPSYPNSITMVITISHVCKPVLAILPVVKALHTGNANK